MHVVALQGHNYSCELEVYAEWIPIQVNPARWTLCFAVS